MNIADDKAVIIRAKALVCESAAYRDGISQLRSSGGDYLH
jgi:hypothetical protein